MGAKLCGKSAVDISKPTEKELRNHKLAKTQTNPEHYANAERMVYLSYNLKKLPLYDRNLLVVVLKFANTCDSYVKDDKELVFYCHPCGRQKVEIFKDPVMVCCTNCPTKQPITKCTTYKKITGRHVNTTYCKICHKYFCNICVVHVD